MIAEIQTHVENVVNPNASGARAKFTVLPSRLALREGISRLPSKSSVPR